MAAVCWPTQTRLMDLYDMWALLRLIAQHHDSDSRESHTVVAQTEFLTGSAVVTQT
jgi:hypothetical protein